MKLNNKISAPGSKSGENEHINKETDTEESAMEKFVKDKTEDKNKAALQTNKTGITGFNSIGLDGSKKVSGQRAFAKKMSRMSHYITKK